MKVGVIIPALNESSTIGKLIKSINACSYHNKVVIVVDGGSTDKTLEICEKLGAIVLKEVGDKCPANARNIGGLHAIRNNADILVFLDADCTGVNPGFFEAGLDLFDEWTAGVCASYKNEHDTWIERVISQREGVCMEPTFIRAHIFESVGGFPLIGYGEDQIFTKKVKRLCMETGRRLKTTKKAIMRGHAVQTLGDLYRQKKWYGRTAPMFLKELGKL